jgi:hypothetical protein
MAIAAVPEAKLLPNLGDRLRAFAARLVPPMSATGRAAAAGGPDIRSRLHPSIWACKCAPVPDDQASCLI